MRFDLATAATSGLWMAIAVISSGCGGSFQAVDDVDAANDDRDVVVVPAEPSPSNEAGSADTSVTVPVESSVEPHDSGVTTVADAAIADHLVAADRVTPVDAKSDAPARHNSGECEMDRDCDFGRCVELLAGGFRACIESLEITSCAGGRLPEDQCCRASDCAMGKSCVEGPVKPTCSGFDSFSYVCASDECQSDATCMGSYAVCLPRGALTRPMRTCATGGCRTDLDCTAGVQGICAPVMPSCCFVETGLYCVYKGGCRSDDDCAFDSYCNVVGREARCVKGTPVCP
jgi:hypothetical protein